MSRKGYSYRPVSFPEEDDTTHEKFTGNNWDCIERLFPKIGVNLVWQPSLHKSVSSNDNLLTIPKVNDDFVVCAMMDLRPITFSTGYQNRIYFKSEVVVRGDNYGGAMGTGLSTVPRKKSESAYENDLNFEYNLLLFKKGDDQKWKVDTGYSWYNFYQDLSNLKFFIQSPSGEGGLQRYAYTTNPPNVPRKTGTGIAEVDLGADSKNKDLLQSIHVYIDDGKYAEFFGNDGSFSGSNNEGFTAVNQVYESEGDNKGGHRISTESKNKNLSTSLKAGYAPFKDKKLKGTNLEDVQNKCYGGSRKRNHGVADGDEIWRDLCYTRN